MTLGIGVIGCGRWGQNYVRVFNELPGVELVGACDADPGRLRLMAQRYSQLATFVDPDDLLRVPHLDAVAVALPVSAQYRVVRTALSRGKHVLAEKPFVLTLDEGLELVELADRMGMRLMVGYVFLYHTAVHALKAYLDDRDEGIGQIYYLYATRTALGPIRKDVNAAWDLAAHDIAIFSYLLGDWPVAVSAVGSRFLRTTRDDVTFASLKYPGGVVGHIHVSWADPSRVRQVVVVGSRARILFDDVNVHEQIRVFEKGVYCSGKDPDSFGEFILAVRDGDIRSPRIEAREPLKSECEHFLGAIDLGRPPLSDGRFALGVLRVLDALQQSVDEDGAPVTVSCGYALR